MQRPLAPRRNTIVANCAGAKRLFMVYERGRFPRCHAVASRACIRRGDVSARLSRGNNGMTNGTGNSHFVVINFGRWPPNARAMARSAGIGGWHVFQTFLGSDYSVVARCT